jgi:hypothetical protein
MSDSEPCPPEYPLIFARNFRMHRPDPIPTQTSLSDECPRSEKHIRPADIVRLTLDYSHCPHCSKVYATVDTWDKPHTGTKRKLEKSSMPRKIKQHKPMGFGDRDDRGSVEAHLRAKFEAKETRQYNRRMKELEAEHAKRKSVGFLSRLIRFLKGR